MGKFERFGQKSGKTGQFGQGNYVRQLPPATAPLTFADFTGGYDSRQMRDGTPANCSSDEIDLDLTNRGWLEPMPGTTQVVSLAGHVTQQMALHPSLGGWAELIFFQPPFIGVLGASGVIRWTDIGMPVTGELVAHAVFGEKMIFYNKRGDPYIRIAGDDGAVAAPTVPRAVSYAVFGGRMWALGCEIDGALQPMGVQWSSVNGNPVDFTGPGAQPELLIDETIAGDRIICGRTMGLGSMAILCRRSVWIASFTGDVNRPGDLQPRVKGAGCINPETARATPAGIIYLSDDGVRLFDGNQSTVISPPINNELLPLDQANLKKYAATYDPIRNRYILLTPTSSWHLDLNNRRWLRSSLISSSGTLFAQQIAGTTWQALVGDWNSLNNTTWLDLSNRETDVAELHFLGKPGADTLLHKLDPASATNFGLARVPYWTLPRKPGSDLNSMVETKGVNLEYTAEIISQVRISVPDIYGDWEVLRTDFLNATPANRPRTVKLPALHSGLGASAKIEFLSGTMDLAQIQLMVADGGPRIATIPPPLITGINPAVMVAGDILDVVISGENFLNGATVQISGDATVVLVSTTVVNPGQIIARIHALAAVTLGVRQVTVTTTVGVSNAVNLTVNANTLPVAPIFWYEATQGIKTPVGQNVVDATPVREKAKGYLLGPAGTGLVGPVYRDAGFGGGPMPYLEFNNAHGIKNPNLEAGLSVTSFTIFSVFWRDPADANSCIHFLQAADHLTADVQDNSASSYASRWNALHTVLNESAYQSVGWIPKNTRLILRHEFNGTHVSHKLYLNGAQQALANQLVTDPGILPSGPSWVQIGYRDNVNIPVLNLQGHHAALLIFTPMLSAPNAAAVEAYLNKFRVP